MTAAGEVGDPDALKAQRSLVSKALRGGVWTSFGFALSQALRLGGNIVLAALLFEEAFAVAALAAAVLQGIVMFSDFGIGPSVVQNRRGDDPAFLDTAWTMQILRGILLTLIAIALSQPLAGFYAANDPLAVELAWFIPLSAAAMALAGFSSPGILTAGRHMQLARVTLIELLAQIMSLVVMIWIAWVTRSVYALAAGGVAQAATTLTLSYVFFRVRRPRFMIERDALREIFHFGKWLFLSTLLSFLAMQLDKFAFAGAFSFQVVGVYAIAAGLTALAPTFLGKLQLMVAFPLYSRVMGADGDVASVFNQFRTIALVFGAFIAAMIIGTSESFIVFAYDERYRLAADLIPPLMLAAWFAVVESVYGAVFLAAGRAGWLVMTNLTKVVVFAVLFYVAQRMDDFMIAVYAVVAADFAKASVAVVLGRYWGLRSAWVDAIWTLILLGAGFASIFVGRWLVEQLGLHIFVVLLIQCILIGLAFSWFLLRSVLSLKSLWAQRDA